jgi:hypothetical protein
MMIRPIVTMIVNRCKDLRPQETGQHQEAKYYPRQPLEG